MLENFSWLEPGAVAGMARPRTVADLQALYDAGVRAVLTLTEEPLPATALAASGLTGAHVPIPDFTAPSVRTAATAIAFIDEQVRAGAPVAVHCAAGIGRTGTILACWLVARGAGAEDAIARVRAVRPGSLEVQEQEHSVVLFARSLDRA